MSANVSSFRTKSAWSLTSGVDLQFLQETGVTPDRLKSSVACAKAEGWKSIHTCACASDIAGGVAVLAKQSAGIRIQLLWQAEGRVQLVAVHHGALSYTVLNVYGKQGEMDTTQRLLDMGITQQRERGNGLGMLLGDLNGEADQFEALALLQESQWQRLHPATVPTCYAAGSAGTAIDVCIASPELSCLVTNPFVDHDETFLKPHHPLCWTMPGAAHPLRVPQLVPRRELPGGGTCGR